MNKTILEQYLEQVDNFRVGDRLSAEDYSNLLSYISPEMDKDIFLDKLSEVQVKIAELEEFCDPENAEYEFLGEISKALFGY